MIPGKPHYYILNDDHTVTGTDDVVEWGNSFYKDRHVGTSEIHGHRISTVFIGIDHNWGPGEPLLFETMIFGPTLGDYQTRCSTWEQAEEMHYNAVAAVLQDAEFPEDFKLIGYELP
jgi:hypothetical protein